MSDFPKFYTHKTRKARKTHRCCECGGTIQPEELYEYHSGLWNDYPESFCMCSDCTTLSDDLNDGRDFDDRTKFQELFEDCSNTDDSWLDKMVAIMKKRGAKVPDWCENRLVGDEE